MTKVLVLVGSLRAESVNRKLAEAVQADPPPGVEIEIAHGLGELPFFNEDVDGDSAPANVTGFREQLSRADRLLIITPEYNGSTPAVIANAIDWASRPFGEGSIKDKALAVVGTAVGQYGGEWAHEHARRSAGIAGAHVVADLQLSHAYEWGTDPSQDSEVVSNLVNVVAKLAVYEGTN